MSLTPAFLDELRARTSLSALVGKTVKLTRAGREMKGCCPFHNEKTPSFYVNDDKGFYHCFGCSAHGDAIRWMTDHQGLPFIDAVKELAAAAGLDMPEQDARAAQRAERAKSLHDVMQAAADFFTQQLGGIEGAAARALLERRGVSAATTQAFGFGYSPDSRGRLRAALKDFGDAMLVEAGLLIQVEGKEPYDRFRGRLMIPIRDPRGRVIAFGGRIIGEGEPKYLNSPDTPLFDKGRTLYNLERAAPAARKADRLFVVEGYMDAIALAQGGVGEVVAPLGTALTEHQLERLWRVVDVPILCLDGDGAGQKAAIRAAHRALPMLAPGRSLAFVTLPDGEDPDDLMRAKGKPAFEALVREAEPLVDRLWKHELAAEPLTTPEQRAGLKRRLSDLAGSIADPAVKSEYQAEFRHRFDEQFARTRQPFQQRQPFYPIGQRRSEQRGPGQKWTPPLPPVTEDARRLRAAGGIDPILSKAVVAGLLRHPAEIARHMEVLGSLKLADGALGRVFEAVVDVALADTRAAPLDSGRLVTILAQSGFDTIAHDLLRADAMPYSFTRADADAKQAREDLDEAIAILVTRPEVDAALAEATSAMMERFTDEAFQRQVALVNEQRALDQRLANLVQANEDARALGLEDD
ncbi:DNA primase [Sphingomonas ginsenosidimutans]|uniref:DNA primase n=1 Tax=Sphingomonas ginsenosidimutans TaxID=862134 RepID=A0A2A4HTL6_9SPHN|nr:DNA primase [Sphingomonas ginsenosidimutans]PCG08242.1 DNA primase [Sphingomonas ginsenosidimutans]